MNGMHVGVYMSDRSFVDKYLQMQMNMNVEVIRRNISINLT